MREASFYVFIHMLYCYFVYIYLILCNVQIIFCNCQSVKSMLYLRYFHLSHGVEIDIAQP
jgi:hypothetical protein